MAINKSSKKRLWAFVGYPESLPKDWVEQIKMSGLKCAISPLHDKDINADGEKKKPHYHIILVYSGPTTYNNVATFTQSLNATAPIPLEQIRGYYNYLTHKDNPEKYQYDSKDIVLVNGFNVTDFMELTKSELLDLQNQLMDLIDDCGFLEYSDFLFYVRKNCSRDLNEVANSNTILFNAYLRSKRHRNPNVPLGAIQQNESGTPDVSDLVDDALRQNEMSDKQK